MRCDELGPGQMLLSLRRQRAVRSAQLAQGTLRDCAAYRRPLPPTAPAGGDRSVNFEKPYTEALEGVSTVLKSTPPGPKGEKRLTPGYPVITATIVNLPEPVITYANWFSYKPADFISENREITVPGGLPATRSPTTPLRFVG